MLVQVIEIQYDQHARGAEWATARNAIPRLHRDRLPTDPTDYTLIRYAQAPGHRFRIRQPRDQYRPELKTYGVMPTPDGARIIPGRPTWALPDRSHRPAFVKPIPPGTWARYQTNARHAGYDGTSYFEWAINIAHPAPGVDPFTGDPSWTVDLRADLF